MKARTRQKAARSRLCYGFPLSVALKNVCGAAYARARVCACCEHPLLPPYMSMRPGVTIKPVASNSSTPSTDRSSTVALPTRTMRPSSTMTSS